MAADRKTARGKAPIAWHPLFPAMVAVWFGALFGLGVLAVRVSLIERVAVASGIDLIVPAAAPPLGMTARILIALGLALAGGIIGAAVGNLLARSKPSAVARRAEAAAAKAASLAETAPFPVVSADTPSFIDVSELGLDPEVRTAPEHQVAEPAEPIEAILVEEAAEAAAPEPAPAGAKRVRRADPAYFPLPAAFPVPGGVAAQRLISADLDDLSPLELIERLALSLQKRREQAPVYLDAASAEAAAPQPPQAPSYYSPAPKPIAARFAAVSAIPAPAEIDEAAGAPEGTAIALFPDPPVAALRQDSEATERALRDALAVLQRMSGAA